MPEEEKTEEEECSEECEHYYVDLITEEGKVYCLACGESWKADEENK